MPVRSRRPLSFTGISRTKYVRTDATTEYFTYGINLHWVIYNPRVNCFFVSDPSSNHVFVLDATTETEIASIPVPGAYGLDDTPDHSLVYVGTQIGDVYVIDAASLVVVKRYIASQIGPYGFRAYSAQVMADGRIALLGGQGGIANVDGYAGFAVWDPDSNSIQNYASSYGGISAFWPLIPYKQVCGTLLNIAGFSRTPDRTRIVVASIDSDSTLCVVDEATGSDTFASTGAVFPVKFTQTPDGNSIITTTYNPDQVVVFDAHTLTVKSRFSIAGDTSTESCLFVSPDSKTLFTTSESFVYAYDLTSQQLVGWLSNIYVSPNFVGVVSGIAAIGPNIQATNGSGLLVGPMEEGVGFLDSAAMHTGPVGKGVLNAYLNPATGPTTGGTSVSWSVPFSAMDSVYFGMQKTASMSLASGMLNVTVPPASSGPVDVYAFASDGSLQIIPDAFSYGPTILQVTPDTVTTAGLGSGYIYGYGFGPTNATSIPADLQVFVGGTQANISGFDPNAYGQFSPPFPLQAIAYTMPPGVLGSADITVTTANGTTTARNAVTYISAVQTYFRPGSSLQQGIYDPHRDLYYFTDATSIQVFSRTQGQWLAPMTIANSHRLWGLSLSPDGSKLAVADAGADTIYLLDPSSSASIKAFAGPTNAGTDTEPRGVAVSDSGSVYFTVSVNGCSGCMGYYKLDTSSGKLTDYRIQAPDLWSEGVQLDAFLRTAISSDNARVYFNDDGQAFSIDTATDAVYYAAPTPGCCYGDYDLALSGNQTRFAATGYFFDADLNVESSIGMNFRESSNISYLYGMKLSADGRLLFQPTPTGIDVLDARVGNLWRRIELAVIMSTGYDGLVADGRDNVLVAITGLNMNSISVVDLSSISEPAPLAYDRALTVAHPQLAPATAMTGSARPAVRGHSNSVLPNENRSRPRHLLGVGVLGAH